MIKLVKNYEIIKVSNPLFMEMMYIQYNILRLK